MGVTWASGEIYGFNTGVLTLIIQVLKGNKHGRGNYGYVVYMGWKKQENESTQQNKAKAPFQKVVNQTKLRHIKIQTKQYYHTE